jgi:hypothetical protein
MIHRFQSWLFCRAVEHPEVAFVVAGALAFCLFSFLAYATGVYSFWYVASWSLGYGVVSAMIVSVMRKVDWP